MSQISHLLVMRLTTFMNQEMITNNSDVNTKPNIIQAYRFQDSPLKYPVAIAISSGNPDDPNYVDGRVGTGKDMNDLGIDIPSGEIGGGHLWWRRGRVKLGCYYLQGKVDQEDAGDYAHRVLGLAMSCIETCPVSDLVDEHGERAHWMAVTSDTFFEGGGPENQYLWRGNILWQVLTERPY